MLPSEEGWRLSVSPRPSGRDSFFKEHLMMLLQEASQTYCAFFWLPYMSSGAFTCLACVLGFTHAIASDRYGLGLGFFL